MFTQNHHIKRNALLRCLISALRITRFNSDSSAPFFIKNAQGELTPQATDLVFALPDVSKTPFADWSNEELFKCGLTLIPDKQDVFEACCRLQRHFDLSNISIFKPYLTGYILNLHSKHFSRSWILPRRADDSRRWEGLLVYEDFYSEPFLLFPYFSSGKSGKSKLSLKSTTYSENKLKISRN